METPRTEKIMSTGEKQAFEGMFQIKIPEGPSTTDSLQQLLIASMMSLKSDTTKTNTDLERIGGEVEEVKGNVRKIEDKTEELERRLKLLEQNQPGGHKRPADEALAVEDAKKIVVFWPIEGYTRDRKAMQSLHVIAGIWVDDHARGKTSTDFRRQGSNSPRDAPNTTNGLRNVAVA